MIDTRCLVILYSNTIRPYCQDITERTDMEPAALTEDAVEPTEEETETALEEWAYKRAQYDSELRQSLVSYWNREKRERVVRARGNTAAICEEFGLKPIQLKKLARRYPSIRIAHGVYDRQRVAFVLDKMRQSVPAAEIITRFGLSEAKLARLVRRYPYVKLTHNRYDPEAVAYVLQREGMQRRYAIYVDILRSMAPGETRFMVVADSHKSAKRLQQLAETLGIVIVMKTPHVHVIEITRME